MPSMLLLSPNIATSHIELRHKTPSLRKIVVLIASAYLLCTEFEYDDVGTQILRE